MSERSDLVYIKKHWEVVKEVEQAFGYTVTRQDIQEVENSLAGTVLSRLCNLGCIEKWSDSESSPKRYVTTSLDLERLENLMEKHGLMSSEKILP